MNEEPQKLLSNEDQIEKVKSLLVFGIIIVISVAAIFAFIIYSKMNNG